MQKKGFINPQDEENIRKLCQTVITEYLHSPSKDWKIFQKYGVCYCCFNCSKYVWIK